MNFKIFNLATQIESAIQNQSYKTPTPIQNEVIPIIMDGKDIVAKAQTGSGKTASFVLPILNHWLQNMPEGKPKIKTLVLTPTRELTLQVSRAFEDFSSTCKQKPKVVSIIGGKSLGDQMFEVQQGCDIVVATAGRLLEIIRKGQINLSKLEHFVLDEADKMLDLGFVEELDLILKEIPTKRQTLLFSATYPTKMAEIASKITINPIEVTIKSETNIVENIKQRAIRVNQENRGPLLRELIRREKLGLILVFMANKRASDNIAAKFRKYGFDAESFHGGLEQEDRVMTLEDFKDKKFKILFATDIAARGLDIEDINTVINFDLPRSPADYVHRIGRTARAGKSGISISFVTHENLEHFKLIEKKNDIKLELEEIKDFELSGEAIQKEKGLAPVKGKRKSKKDKLREAKS